MKKSKKFHTCPFCKESLEEYLTYVEDGVTNYLNYRWGFGEGWYIDDETNGENATETYYICRNCNKTLPDDYQDYFSNNL